MTKNNRFIQLVKQHTFFSVMIVLELVILLVIVILSLNKPVTYVLNGENLIVNDPTVVTNEDGTFLIENYNEGESAARWSMSSDKLRLPWGMYEIEVNYTSALHSPEDDKKSCYDSTGVIQLISEEDPNGFQYKDIYLHDGAEQNANRLWIRSFVGIDDLKVNVCFLGTGSLYVVNLIIKELIIWRIVRILFCLLLFAVIDIGCIYFFTDNQYQNKGVVAGIAATVIISSLPLFADFLFGAHDIPFHLVRIQALAEGLKSGHWIVPIQTEVNNGYGYTTPLFYSQLFLYVPAILYCMAVPLQVCYQIYAFLCNMATCLICYYCMKWLLKDKMLAVAVSFLYTCSAYRITNLYVRGALGEYTAITFLPLVLYGFERVYLTEKDKITWKEYLPIVIGLSGLIQCHILSCEISAFFIIILCIMTIKKTLQPNKFLGLLKAALLTISVNLGFLVPFVQSMKMDIEVKNRINKIQMHGAYPLQVFGITMEGTSESGSGIRVSGDMPLSIGFALAVGLAVYLVCYAKRFQWKTDKDKLMQAGAAYTGFAILSMICSMRFFPWDSLYHINESLAKILCVVQFPWRYLVLGTVFCVFAAGIGLKYLGDFWGGVKRDLVCGAMILLTLVNLGCFYTKYGNQSQTLTAYGDLSSDTNVGDEYFLTGTERNDLQWRNIIADDAVTIEKYDYTEGVTTFWCKNAADTYNNVEIPLFNYDNYHAYALNDEHELRITNGTNNVVSVAIEPNYEGMVEVRYEIPLLWKLSYVVSVITIIGIIAVIIYGRRLEKKSGEIAAKRG